MLSRFTKQTSTSSFSFYRQCSNINIYRTKLNNISIEQYKLFDDVDVYNGVFKKYNKGLVGYYASKNNDNSIKHIKISFDDIKTIEKEINDEYNDIMKYNVDNSALVINHIKRFNNNKYKIRKIGSIVGRSTFGILYLCYVCVLFCY